MKIPAALAGLGLLVAAPLDAQRVTKDPAPPGGDTAWFAALAMGDTIAREGFTRSPARLEGTLYVRRPQQLTVGYTGFLRPGARGDSLVVRSTRGEASATSTIRVQGDTLPFLNMSVGILDWIVRRARAAGGAPGVVPLHGLGQPAAARVTFAGDSAVLDLMGAQMRIALAPDGGFAGATVPAQGVRFVRTTRPAATGAGAVAADPYGAPAGAPYTAENVTLRTPAGITLAGTLTLPAGAGAARRAPVVVLISGSGPQNRDSELMGMAGYRIFRQFADSLGRRGVGVLRLDDRGTGGSDRGPADVTSADFANDIRAAIEWLRRRPDVDAGRLGLAGHSEGGLIAALVAAEDPRIAAVALLATASRPGRELSAHQRRMVIAHTPGIPAAARDSVFRATQAAADSAAQAMAWTRYWWTFDPRPTLRRVRAPVLVLHGETDAQVPVAQGEELAAVLREAGNRDVTVRRFPGVNHLFLEDPSGYWGGYAALPSRTVPAAVVGALADWLADRLRA